MYLLYTTNFTFLKEIELYFINHSLYSVEQIEEYRVKMHTTLREKDLFFNDKLIVIKEDNSFELPSLSLLGYSKSIFPSEKEISNFSGIQFIELDNEAYDLLKNNTYFDKTTLSSKQQQEEPYTKYIRDCIPALIYGIYQLIHTYQDTDVSYSSLINLSNKKGIEVLCKELRMLDYNSKEFNDIKRNLMMLSDKIISLHNAQSETYKKRYMFLKEKARKENISLNYNKNILMEKGIIASDGTILDYKTLCDFFEQDFDNQILLSQTRKHNKMSDSGKKIDDYLNYFPKSIHNRKQFVGWIWECDSNGCRYQKPIDVLHSTKDALFSASLLEEKDNPENIYSWTTLQTCIEKVKELELDGIGIMLGFDLCAISIQNGYANGEYSAIAKQFINKTKSFTTRQKNGDICIYGFYKANPTVSIPKSKIRGISYHLGAFENSTFIPAAHFIAEDGYIVKDCPIVHINSKNETDFNFILPKEDVFALWDNYSKITDSKVSRSIIDKLENFYNMQKKKYEGLNKFHEIYYNANWYPFYKEGITKDNLAKDFIMMVKRYTNNPEEIRSIFKSSAIYSIEEWEEQKLNDLLKKIL